MKTGISRRSFFGSALAAGALSVAAGAFGRGKASPQTAGQPGFPLVDYHVHLDDVVTLEKALELSKERGVRFGIVEHAGTRENRYPGLLSTDEDLKRYIAMLEGKPVLKGIQAEGIDWITCFSKGVVAQLDYVLSDALTFPDKKSGRRIELWRSGVAFDDKQDFMDRYVDFHVEVMAREPLDIIANPTFLPASMESEFDSLWTPARMKKLIDAAVKYDVAIEINSRYLLPRMSFLKMARAAGAKFSTGSNIHGLDVGKLDYCVEVIRQLGLTKKDIFTPAPRGKKPIEVRRFTS